MHIILQNKTYNGPSPKIKATRVDTVMMKIKHLAQLQPKHCSLGEGEKGTDQMGTWKQEIAGWFKSEIWNNLALMLQGHTSGGQQLWKRLLRGCAITFLGFFQDTTRQSLSQPDLALEIILLSAFATLIFLTAFAWIPMGARWVTSEHSKKPHCSISFVF